MNNFEKLEDGIFRLCIPFDGIYTTVFLLKTESGTALIDSATYPEDVDNYILPALKQLEATPDILLCSHMHSDHNGGMKKITKSFPKMKIGLFSKEGCYKNPSVNFKDKDLIFGRFEILNLKGHTTDCLGVFDLKSKTLITCDALQQKGVGKYKPTAESKEEYLNTVERIAEISPNRIICSHDYEPFGYSVSKEDIPCLLEVCKKYI